MARADLLNDFEKQLRNVLQSFPNQDPTKLSTINKGRLQSALKGFLTPRKRGTGFAQPFSEEELAARQEASAVAFSKVFAPVFQLGPNDPKRQAFSEFENRFTSLGEELGFDLFEGVPAITKRPAPELPTSTSPLDVDGAGGGDVLRALPAGGFDDQTDRFLLEEEGLRQEGQRRRSLESQRSIREERLGDLSSLLREREEFQFGQARPGIAEESQAGGLLRSSGFGEALARERGKLAGVSSQALAEQSLRDRNFETQGLADILQGRQAFQGAGLQRQFSLEDFERSGQLSREIGALSTPSVGGGGKGQAIATAVAGGVGAGLPGAIAGGIGGSKKGK